MNLCPTCGRRASERDLCVAYPHDTEPFEVRIECEPCPDPLHDAADRVGVVTALEAEVARLKADNERLSARDETRTTVLYAIEARLNDGDLSYEEIHEAIAVIIRKASMAGDDGFSVVQVERDELRAEVARLREALEYIANDTAQNYDHQLPAGDFARGVAHAGRDLSNFARTALAPAAQKDGG